MSFEIILNGRIVNSKNIPVSSATVNLNAVIQQQTTINGYRNTTNVFTATTDTNGNVQFSGVAAGNYDVQVVSGNTYTMWNYPVKNSFIVNTGGSEIAEESRTFIRSSEVFSGVNYSTEPRPTNQLGYPNELFTHTYNLLNSGTSNYVSKIDDSAFSRSFANNRDTGDVTYKSNQLLKMVQSFTFKIPA